MDSIKKSPEIQHLEEAIVELEQSGGEDEEMMAGVCEALRAAIDAGEKERYNTFSIETMDIVQSDAECIVNAANESLLGGGGVDAAIHRAAGPELAKECAKLGGCKTGEAKITKGYNLKAKYVIHTVGPIYTGSQSDAKQLRDCYWNCLDLARRNDIHSIVFPSISTGAYGYPIKEASKIAVTAIFDWQKVNLSYGMRTIIACFNDETRAEYFDRYFEYKDSEIGSSEQQDPEKLNEAICFAVERHSGQVRKGSNRPYILHPIETLQILASMKADTNLLIAGVLHDTLEDTDTTLKEIVDRFGVDVAALVSGHSEDKRFSWYRRKLTAINHLSREGDRGKMLVMADKVANLRSMYNDYKEIGDELWTRFNAPKAAQAWYYSEVEAALYDFRYSLNTYDVYWEMVALYKDLFVEFAIDEEAERLYQLSISGEHWVLNKGNPEWKKITGVVSGNIKIIPRKRAERIEDNWNDMLSVSGDTDCQNEDKRRCTDGDLQI